MSEQPSYKKYISLVVFIIIIGAIASTSYLPTFGTQNEWFLALNKPGYMPPNWLFGVTWPILYLLMAVAVWFIWRARKQHSIWKALLLFSFQLLVCITWTELFFGLQNAFLGFIWILVLWVLIGLTFLLFWKICYQAGALLLPYWLWISFAAVLVGHVWLLNF